jgi:hypothetical protein
VIKVETSWVAPLEGLSKINTDGAFVQATKQGGCSFIVRDYSGEPVLAGVGNLA